MESQHMTQQTFANFIGTSAASLSSIFNDRTKPTVNIITAIKDKIPDISLDWLMFGDGPMYKTHLSSADGNVISDSSLPKDRVPGNNSGGIDLFDMPPVTSPKPLGQTQVPQSSMDLNFIDKTPKKITEIRVFYDDLTYESFVPKK